MLTNGCRIWLKYFWDNHYDLKADLHILLHQEIRKRSSSHWTQIFSLTTYTFADAYPLEQQSPTVRSKRLATAVLEGQAGVRNSNPTKAVFRLLSPCKSTEDLIPSIWACGLIWREGLYRGNQVKLFSNLPGDLIERGNLDIGTEGDLSTHRERAMWR